MSEAIQALLAKLSEYDFILVIDKSGSMGEPNKGNSGLSRWEYMQETATAFSRDIGKIDSDGFDIVLFGGSDIQSFQGVTTDKVKEIFGSNRPSGGTPLAEALQAAFKLAGKSEKKDFIVVFTDGIPDDQNAAAAAIKAKANAQESDDDCTVLFVQIGNDSRASAYLKSLDDDLKGAKFDIVDAKTIDEVEKFSSTVELIAAAIND